MGVYERDGSPFWWYDFKLNGERYQGSTGTVDKKLAIDIYQKKRSQAVAGSHFPLKVKTRLHEMVETYLNDYSKTAKKSYRQDLSNAKKIKAFFGDCLLADITPHKIELYRAKRIGENISKARINRDLAFLRHVFTKALEWGKWAGDNPVKKIRAFKEERKPERYLSYEERESLFQNSPVFLKPVILLALKTGLRQGEIVNLKWEDVDLKRAVISVRNNKASKLRQLPIHASLLDVLSRMPSRSPYVFCDDQGNKLSQNGLLRGAFQRAVTHAKIHNFTFHDLRHTFASELIMKGVDVKTVQEYLGHSSVAVTERYLHVAPNQKRTSIQLLGLEKDGICYTNATLPKEPISQDEDISVKSL